MKEKLALAGQIVLGIIVGNVIGKGMELAAEKAKKAVENHKEKAQN